MEMKHSLKHLKMSDKGFYIDEAFIERVKKKTGSKKKKDIIDQLLCATVIAEFMTTFEVKLN